MANVSRYVSGLLFFGILACLFIPASAESVSYGYQPDPIQFSETGNSYILNNSELEIEFFKDTLGYNQYRNARNGSVLIYNARTWVDYLGPGDKWKPAGIAQTTSYKQIYRGYEITRHYTGIQADYDVIYTWIENRPVKHTIYITGKVEDDFQVSESYDGVVGTSKIKQKSVYAGDNYNLVISIQDVIKSFGDDSVDVTETTSANGKKFDYTFGSWGLNFSDMANGSHQITIDPSVTFNGTDNWAGITATNMSLFEGNYIITYHQLMNFTTNASADDWTKTGTDIYVDDALNYIQATGNRVTVDHHLTHDAIILPHENSWKIQYKYDYITETSHGIITVGLADTDENIKTASVDNASSHGLWMIHSGTGGVYLRYNDGTNNPSSLQIDISTGNTYYIQIEKVNSTQAKISVFSDSSYTTHIANSPKTVAINANATGLKYIIISNYKLVASGGTHVHIDDMQVLSGQLNNNYLEIDNAQDAGANQVHKYFHVEGTNPSDNTSLAIQANVSNDNSSFSWIWINNSCNVDDNVTASIANEYRYLGSPAARFWSNTTWQPETNIISNITITSDTKTITSPVVTLLSMTPSEICQNCTGNLSILYGISHNSIGLNNTSVSFIYRNYDYDCACSNHSIRPPNNNLATLWDLDGRILRAANRNESLNFENNATITGGDDYTWSGLDENNSRLTIVPVNSTYTKVYINGTIHDVMPQMWYLDRTDLQEAPKTSIGVHKFNNVLIKFWNFEIFQGNTDFLGVGYTDTYLNPNPIFQPLDANPVNFYYVNSSYDPAIGGDPLTSGYSVYMGSLNASGWVDHIYSPHINSNYVRGFIDNNILETYLNTTNISYLYFTSNTPSSKPYYINMTDVASSTNVSFANTNVLWAGNTPPYAAQAYTPNIWFAFMKLNISLDQKLYVADNNDQWSNSTMNRTNISSGLFPPTKPSFYSFHNGFTDYDMNGTYHDTIQIQVSASSDPDGGTVTHNITLHYGNDTYVATINGSAVAEDGVYTNVTFNTTLYYSQTENYTLRVVATDDESETATTWLGVNFSLDGSPRIISYSPGTPIYSREGENQTFSITTNILGNVTWYIDSVEIFNETLVTYSSYSNSTASLGYHNVTVITTNINGTNSMKWDWTVRTRLWSLVVDSVVWGISVAQYLVSNIGIVITTAFSLICILILAMLIGAALSVTKLIYR